MNNIDELLSRWDEHRTFKEMPFREDMKYCTVTIDEPEKRGLDELLSNIRHRINNKVKSIRKGMER
jgi:hypothetical protein